MGVIQRTAEQQAAIEAALGHSPSGGTKWRPYCLRCATMQRMDETLQGFRCSSCQNEIGYDLIRLNQGKD